MPWTDVDHLSRSAPLPDGYHYELLKYDAIPAVVQAFASWYPNIAVGNASCHLRESFYIDKVVLDGGEPERDFFVVLFKKDHELVGVLSVERDTDSEVLYGRVFAVSPQHRGLNLSERIPGLIETMGRAMGMGMVYALATLKVPFMAEKFELLGWQLIGIIPGFDREMVEPGVIKRVYEAIYAKVLVDEKDFVLPRRSTMTPKTAALFDLLYPGKVDAT